MTEQFHRHLRPGFDAQQGIRTARALRPSQVVGIAGAVTSLALILGLGIWGYRLAVRDVHGIPVVRALEGPARDLPSDPGGQLSRHTGLAVNAVAADGTAAPPAEQIVLAPEPEALAPEAAPMGELRPDPVIAALPAPEAPAAEPGPEAPLPVTIAAPAALNLDARYDARLGAAPAADPAEAPQGIVLPDRAADVPLLAPIPASVPGVARSPRPPVRPARPAEVLAALDSSTASIDATDALAEDAVAAAVAAAVAQAIAAPGPAREIDVATLAPGTRLAQIGAFDDPETARREWAAVEADFAALMAGKARVIEQAESGGRIFYRLRVAGFEDAADARRFCAALLAEGTACIPAQAR